MPKRPHQIMQHHPLKSTLFGSTWEYSTWNSKLKSSAPVILRYFLKVQRNLSQPTPPKTKFQETKASHTRDLVLQLFHLCQGCFITMPNEGIWSCSRRKSQRCLLRSELLCNLTGHLPTLAGLRLKRAVFYSFWTWKPGLINIEPPIKKR